MLNLELYYRPTCPFCRKVLDFLECRQMTLELKDITDQQNRDKLVEVGGKPQVPCLFIGGKAMYESDDIIKWLTVNG